MQFLLQGERRDHQQRLKFLASGATQTSYGASIVGCFSSSLNLPLGDNHVTQLECPENG